MCLRSAGPTVTPDPDPWCLANNNLWRVNTDVLQNWVRTMVEVESLANQGYISRPGAWSFPDCMELGNPGGGSLTWQESQAVLALFAVTSSPLILGNDARKGRMQQRLVELLTNPDSKLTISRCFCDDWVDVERLPPTTVLTVNQEYSTAAAFAGGRIAHEAPGKELWAKPLPNNTVAVVLLNRGGVAVGELCPGCTLPPEVLARTQE